MAQYEMNLRDYWLIVRRRRTIIVVATLLVALFSLWLARQKVPSYQATAAVKFEQSTSLSGLLVEVLSYSTADSIETQAAIIKSYPILEEVARRLGRLPTTTGTQAVRESRAYTAALDDIAGKVRTSRVPSTSILEITATSASPREARIVANTVAEAYRDYNKANRNARISEARRFIEAQLKEVETRVRKAEEEVWAFREANRVISPGAESTVLLSLFTQVRGDIEKVRQQRIELEQAQGRLARVEPAALTERVYIDTPNPAIQKLQATQIELVLERNNLSLEVTDRHPRLQAIDDRLREVRREMRREITAQVAQLRNREEILNRQVGDLLQKNREIPAVELSLQRLQRDAKINDDLLTLLKTRHQEALIKESEGVEEVTIIRPATEPTAPTGAEALNTVLVGAMLGLMLGLVLAFVQETLDTSIGTIEDVESYLEVPVLGVVPHIDPRETVQRLIERRPALARMDPEALRNHALLITHFDPKSPVAEAYRALRTNIQFASTERAGKLLVVTSPTLQEGKTTTIVNLALTMAQNGQKTLLVGANLRRPSIYRFFGIEREPGLSDVLVGSADWRDCVRTVADIMMGRFEMEDVVATPGLDNLHIIEAGPIPGNPSELLSTAAMRDFLRAVGEEYDIVLIDTPPVLPVTDAAIVAAQADGVLLVYQAGKVGRLVLKRAKAHLESARAKVWGVVLNDLQREVSGYTYTQYYTHYYGEESPAEPAAGPVGRALDFIRRRLGGSAGAEGGGATATSRAARGASAARYRNSRIGVIFLVALLGVLAIVTAWRLGWLEPALTPRELLRQKLDTGPARVPPPAPAPTGPAPAPTVPAPAPTGPAPPAPAPPAPASPPSPPPAPVRPPPAPRAADPAPAPVAPALPPVAVHPPPSSALAAPPPVPAPARPPAVAAPAFARFALEFGPFLTVPEAEWAERLLGQAGHQTVRVRQSMGGAVYAVLIERIPTRRDARTLATRLRAEGAGETVVLDTEPPSVRVGEPLPLRGAVQLAERLRGNGHRVRIAARPGEATAFVLRYGHFASREAAEAKARELAKLGLPNQVVQVR